MESVDPDKYITFKREEFFQMMGQMALPPWRDPDGNLIGGDWDCAPFGQQIQAVVKDTELSDVVVIRRQDMFAGPALHAYANNMAMAVRMLPRADDEQQKHLLAVADYFHEQAVLADEEAKKLPD